MSKVVEEVKQLAGNLHDYSVEKNEPALQRLSQISSKKLYLMDVAHSGDMYHMRAMMTLDPKAILVLANVSKNEKDRKFSQVSVIDYLSKGREDRVILASKRLQTKLNNEGDATKTIEASLQSSMKKKTLELTKSELQQGMIFPDGPRVYYEGVDEDVTTVFGDKKDAVLILHRNSGLRGNVHPEYDTGHGIIDLIISTKNLGLTPIISGIDRDALKKELGDISEPFLSDDVKFIGEYWKKMTKGENSALPDRMKEAQFMAKAFEDGFFKSVIGFRSGGIDLFTFMAIPTVSIGLQNYVGEERHERLSNLGLNRTLLRYEFPRSPYTVRGRVKSTDEPVTFGSTPNDTSKIPDFQISKLGVNWNIPSEGETDLSILERTLYQYQNNEVTKEQIHALLELMFEDTSAFPTEQFNSSDSNFFEQLLKQTIKLAETQDRSTREEKGREPQSLGAKTPLEKIKLNRHTYADQLHSKTFPVTINQERISELAGLVAEERIAWKQLRELLKKVNDAQPLSKGDQGRGARGTGGRGRGEQGRGEQGRGEQGRGEQGRGARGRGARGRGGL
ncbi:hypothetical protein [Pseudoalteromonas sp. S16_S37]|uniref:hypothetical protein n=1 Tax=Pseudoalteromonas sp. S16_S37 TaxID=2720228 RepID=UPI00168033E1|nr:hypothetical protein [Pseudoalteromonas sp. S16_S37]MBD1582670.1 hypothetical protein [Pseudoalteromonas sp. S16_S37]